MCFFIVSFFNFQKFKLTNLLELHKSDSCCDVYLITMRASGLIRLVRQHNQSQAFALLTYINEFLLAVQLASKRFTGKNIRFETETWILYELVKKHPRRFGKLQNILCECGFIITDCDSQDSEAKDSKMINAVKGAFEKSVDSNEHAEKSLADLLKRLLEAHYQRISWNNGNVDRLAKHISPSKSGNLLSFH